MAFRRRQRVRRRKSARRRAGSARRQLRQRIGYRM